MTFLYIVLTLAVLYVVLRFFVGASGSTSSLDSRIKIKLNLYESIKTSNPNFKKLDIYKRVIESSRSFENRVEEVIDSASSFRKFISPTTKINFQDIVYIMMEEEFRPSDISLASEIFAKIRNRVDELIPKEL